MLLNIKILVIFFFQLIATDSIFQQPVKTYKIKSEERCLILTKDRTNLDTLCSGSFKGDGISKSQIVDENNNIAILIQLKSRGVDNFSGFSYLVEKWEIKNDKFSLESSLKIPLGDCYAKKLGIKLTEDGIKWKYKRGLFKKNLKGLIPYSKLKESKEYHLPCK